MEGWVWLLVYAALFALLHLVLYRYYLRRGGDAQSASQGASHGEYTGSRSSRGRDRSSSGGRDGGTDRRSGGSSPSDDPRETGRASEGDRSDDFDQPHHDVDGETIECPRCGAVNDADRTYTYCWRCISAIRQ